MINLTDKIYWEYDQRIKLHVSLSISNDVWWHVRKMLADTLVDQVWTSVFMPNIDQLRNLLK